MKKRWLSLIMAMILTMVPAAGTMAEENCGVSFAESAEGVAVSVISEEELAGDAQEKSFEEPASGNVPGGASGESASGNVPGGASGESASDNVLAEASGENAADSVLTEASGENAADSALAEAFGENAADSALAEASGESVSDSAPGGTSDENSSGDGQSGSSADASDTDMMDDTAAEDGELQGFDAGDFLIEEISEVDALEPLESGIDGAETLTEEVTGTLQRNSHASDAMLRRYGAYAYSPGQFSGSYGEQLTGQAREAYLKMKAAYVDQRKSGNLEISIRPVLTFLTDGTVSGGKLNWDRERNAGYQEICLTLEYVLQSAFDALVYDYPEVFWMGVPDYTYVISYSFYGGQFKGSISSVTFIPSSAEAYSGASSEIAAFDAAVARAENSIAVGNSREATVRAIHDYLCDRLIYNENTYAHSAGGAFLHAGGGHNYVVCEGYAKAFKILCGRFGIPCILVVGDAGEAHMWNYVKMEDNNWYLVDVTWDDNRYGTPDDDYFLVGSNTPSAVDSTLDVGTERVLYTNFSRSDYTQNFNYPYLSASAYEAGMHKHSWQVIAQLSPTCTEDGYSIYRCSCGEISYESVDATGHSYRNKKYIYNNDATCLRNGTKTAVCDNGCGTPRQTVYADGTKLKATISFNVSSLKLKTKQSTGKFRVTYGKGDYVASWKSSNKKIVKVTGKADGTCTIKAQKKAGTAKITVTLASGKKKSLTVKVQTTAVKTTKISGIPKTLSMGKGESCTLQAKVSPFTSKQKVTYKSSNKKVAAVSKKGVIKAKKKGKATITVQSGSKKVKCKVTVR